MPYPNRGGENTKSHYVIEVSRYPALRGYPNRVIGINKVSIGSLTASIVHPREVFKGAILSNAASIV
jgi:hypothetical protein